MTTIKQIIDNKEQIGLELSHLNYHEELLARLSIPATELTEEQKAELCAWGVPNELLNIPTSINAMFGFLFGGIALPPSGTSFARIDLCANENDRPVFRVTHISGRKDLFSLTGQGVSVAMTKVFGSGTSQFIISYELKEAGDFVARACVLGTNMASCEAFRTFSKLARKKPSATLCRLCASFAGRPYGMRELIRALVSADVNNIDDIDALCFGTSRDQNVFNIRWKTDFVASSFTLACDRTRM